MGRSMRWWTLLAVTALLLSMSSLVLAKAGGGRPAPDDGDAVVAQVEEGSEARGDGEVDGTLGDPVETLSQHNETATAATEFSTWVRSLRDAGITGCQRGQTIAKYARQGPHEFDPAAWEPVPVEELPGRCAEGGDDALEGGDVGTEELESDELETEGDDGEDGAAVASRGRGRGDGGGRPAHAGPKGGRGRP